MLPAEAETVVSDLTGYEIAEQLSRELGVPVKFTQLKKGSTVGMEYQDSPALIHTDQTMIKVSEALAGLGLTDREIENVIDAIQGKGIFFRERSERIRKKCEREGCRASFIGDREGNARAWREGWFLQKWGGPAWCPIHIPTWVRSDFVRQKEQEP